MIRLPELDRATTTPSVLLGAGVLGGFLLGFSGRRPGRAAAGVLGAGLVLLAGNQPLKALVASVGAARRHVRLRRSLEVHRPLREVFTFCRDFENFPRIIGTLRRVVDYEDGRSHWEAYSPAGDLMSWDVIVTKYVPNSIIAWRSLPRSDVESAGQIRFHADGPRKTRVDLDIAFRPVRTTVKDAVATLLGPPPAEQLAQELSRARFYLESLPAKALP